MTHLFRPFAVALLALCFGANVQAEESQQYKNLLTPLLQGSVDVLGGPLAYPAGEAKVTSVIVTIPPGGETGWHSHQVPLYVYVLDGEVTVDYGTKGTKVYAAGMSVLEAMNWPHNGRNKGAVPVRILAVYMGGGDATNTAKEPTP